VIGGMGVDISTHALALEAARLGGIGHVSDAFVTKLSDKYYHTSFFKERSQKFKDNRNNEDKSIIQFDLDNLAQATELYFSNVMNQKKGDGAVFINCMEKLTMNNAKATLKVRLESAMTAGIDGITLSAGLHLGSFELIKNHPRFRDVQLGIIVSSVRALKIFLKKTSRLNRLPDYVIVEGPLAGGHLGFGMDWKKYNLNTIVADVLQLLQKENLAIPVIPAGGIFTGTDGVEFLEKGASAIQVANRFTVTKECGIPDETKQHYFTSIENDVVVSQSSPTGYPFRMLKNSPAFRIRTRPNCESFGFLLDKGGKCSYLDTYYKTGLPEKITPEDKICLCTHMSTYNAWVCGHYVYRLKETTNQLSNNKYQLLTAEHVFNDYRYSAEHSISLPKLDSEQVTEEVSAL
ncbi:MAG: nitronate monooxygenase, partial [bacterium]